MASKVAIVTGASQGIGRGTAIKLAEQFSSLVLVARNEKELQETAALISESNPSTKTLILVADLRQRDAADRIVSETIKNFGKIHSVVNIAGAVPQLDPFVMTDDQWDDGLELKLHAARRLTIRAWESLKETQGSVIFMSGNSALMPKTGFVAVATINAAIVALSKAMADQGIKDGVQVNAVLPGAVLTDRRKGYFKQYANINNTTPEEAMKVFPSKAGISRFGQPEDIANLIAFLVSEQGRWMTGSALIMDGGEIKSV